MGNATGATDAFLIVAGVPMLLRWLEIRQVANDYAPLRQFVVKGAYGMEEGSPLPEPGQKCFIRSRPEADIPVILDSVQFEFDGKYDGPATVGFTARSYGPMKIDTVDWRDMTPELTVKAIALRPAQMVDQTNWSSPEWEWRTPWFEVTSPASRAPMSRPQPEPKKPPEPPLPPVPDLTPKRRIVLDE